MDHYYDVGCTFVELETGQPWDEGQAAAACRDSLTTIPEDCDDLYDDWLVCLGDVEDGDTDAQCTSCDREHEDWIRCAT